MPRPILATIDISALQHNLGMARRHAGSRRLWAVVKANAYGHGIEAAVLGFRDADGLALLDLDEAHRVRAAGWTKPILLLEGFFEPGDLEIVERLELTSVVHHVQQVAMLERHVARRPMGVYVKVNTGMNRLGFADRDATAAAVRRLQALANVRIEALMTHLANADRLDASLGPAGVDEQVVHFLELCGDWGGATSIANSAGLFFHTARSGDAVRPGIVLYGAAPGPERSAAEMSLRPAMHLQSRLIATQWLAAGRSIGYGARYVATRDIRVGVIACGYADGYPRHAPNGTPVSVGGVAVPTVGRVSMDMLCVDLTDVPHADVGAPVELWGARVPIDDVATAAGTVGYELMCALAPRVPLRVAQD